MSGMEGIETVEAGPKANEEEGFETIANKVEAIAKKPTDEVLARKSSTKETAAEVVKRANDKLFIAEQFALKNEAEQKEYAERAKKMKAGLRSEYTQRVKEKEKAKEKKRQGRAALKRKEKAGLERSKEKRKRKESALIAKELMRKVKEGEKITKASVREEVAAKCGTTVSAVVAVAKHVMSVKSAMRTVGITEELIAQKIREGMDATETKIASFEGAITDKLELPDMGERRAYLDMALRLRGDYPKDEISVDLTQRIIRLPAKKVIGDGALVIDVEAVAAEVSAEETK